MATAAWQPAAAPVRRGTLGCSSALRPYASLTGAALMFRGEIVALAHPELGPLPADLIARAERLGRHTGVVFHEETRSALTGVFGKADPAPSPPVRADTLAEHRRALFRDGTPRILRPEW